MTYVLKQRTTMNDVESWTITVTHPEYPNMAVETDVVGTESEAETKAVSLNEDVTAQPATYFGE